MSSFNKEKPSFDSQLQQTKDKDALITLLKSRIFELEQNEKNYGALKTSHTDLQNELTKVKGEMLKTEYDMKQKTEIQHKKILDLTSENDHFQQIINDKVIINKKLYADNEILLTQLDALGKDNEQLIDKHTEIESKYDDLERERNELNAIKSKQEIEIQKLFEDNRKLNTMWKDQDYSIKQFEQNKVQLASKIEEMSYELTNLKGKLKSKEENLLFIKSQNDETKTALNNIQTKLKAAEKDNEAFKTNIDLLQSALSKEKDKYEDAVKNKSEQLKQLIEENKKNAEKYAVDLEIAQRIEKDNNDKLKREINLLLLENKRLVSVIDAIFIQDSKMKSLLKRKENILSMIERNNRNIENSLNTF